MLELSTENAVDFLLSRGWVSPGPVEVEHLSGGVSNAVLRVRTPDRLFVLKQSRPQLRTRDAWFSDLDRVYREQEVMEALHPLLPGVVPEVLHSDREEYVFAMSHAPLDARVWKEDLLAGEVDPVRGEASGQILGRMHEVSANGAPWAAGLKDRNVFIQLRVDPFYRAVQERLPDVAAALAPLIEQLLERDEALCHADYTPKNLLAHRDGFTLVDYETAHLGDPTMDLGLFLAHLLLKASRRPDQAEAFFTLTEAFWKGYGSAVRFRPLDELTARGIAHLGACLLARIDGTSPVDYLPEPEKRDGIRALGRALLFDRPKRWVEVLELHRRLASGER